MIEFIGTSIGGLGLFAIVGGLFEKEKNPSYYIFCASVVALGLFIESLA